MSDLHDISERLRTQDNRDAALEYVHALGDAFDAMVEGCGALVAAHKATSERVVAVHRSLDVALEYVHALGDAVDTIRGGEE